MRLPRRSSLVAAALLGAAAAAFALRAWRLHEAFPPGLLQASGRFEGDHVIVATQVAGRVDRLLAREGDAVTAGQVLARLDDERARARVEQARKAMDALDAEVRAAQTGLEVLRHEVPIAVDAARAGAAHERAALERARATESLAERDARRFRELAERGSAEHHRAEQADLAATSARSDRIAAASALAAAESRLADAQLGPGRIRAKEEELAALRARKGEAQAALAEARSVLDDLEIRAPAAGVVTTRVADLGEVLPAGAALFDLVDFDRLYLKIYVPEVEIGKLRRGLPAQIWTDAFPDRSFAATVRTIASRAEFTPKEVQTTDERTKLVFAVRLYLEENPDHRLTPGLPADAVIRWKEGTPWARPRW